MAKDTEIAVDHVMNVLSTLLQRRIDERVELERDTRNFWTRLQKHLPKELFDNLEAEPQNEAHQTAFKTALTDLINAKQNVMMNTAIFLSKKGISL